MIKQEFDEIAARAELLGKNSRKMITAVVCEYLDAKKHGEELDVIYSRLNGKVSMIAITAICAAYEEIIGHREAAAGIEFENLAGGAPRNWRREYARRANQPALM